MKENNRATLLKRRRTEHFRLLRAASRRRERARITAAVALARELGIEPPDLYLLSHRERKNHENGRKAVWRAFREIGLLQLKGE